MASASSHDDTASTPSPPHPRTGLRSRVSGTAAATWRGFTGWFDRDGPSLGASVAFFSIFALAPVLVVAIAVAGAVFGAEAARGFMLGELSGLVGIEAARNIEAMIASAWHSDNGGLAAFFGVVMLLVAATGVFTELRRALNVMFHAAPRGSALTGYMRARVMALALVLGFGFLLIISLVVSAAFAALGRYLSDAYPWTAGALAALDWAISTLILAAAFAAILRGLPDRAPSRRQIAIGALVGAGLFSLGKHLVGLYLARAGIADSYGAAGSFVVVILWVYYSTQVLLIGAAIGQEFE